ncbi:flagellar protein MotY [Neptunicella marina]|uniref:OmpA family protein n=1 Tax=Neptunicella marina TaxID=2125989 RepID=A0A8J6M5Y3_9ALTE|nr:OmpA family protein [Neptunicella marina]MBC3766821.1 OmpA family protein [Neptunicella marina]
MKKLLTILSLIPFVSYAGVRHYNASVEQSSWKLGEATRLQCSLTHPIDGYGNAVFSSRAGKQLNMEFELDMLSLPDTYSVANVYAVPPKWMPGAMQRPIAEMAIRKQYNGDVPKKMAWTMLSELEKGYWPTIYYQDWYNDNDQVAVGLNASNFEPAYREFVQCVSGLLHFSFDDIEYTVLNYKKNSSELTRQSQKKLGMISDYLAQDQDMELVLVDAYTDSYGSPDRNRQLSEQRANSIKDFFTEKGVDAARIEVTGHGERRHIADNRNELSRAKNRRVVIRMDKP